MGDIKTEPTEEEIDRQNEIVLSMFDDMSESLNVYAQTMYGVDNASKITDNQFCSVLLYINHRYIRDIYNFKNNHNVGHEYKDYESIVALLDIYINLCMTYDKYISVMGFSMFSGIDNLTIEEWREDGGASRKMTEIYKRLRSSSEESLVNNLATGRKNPVGQMGILNNRFGWATSNSRQETVHKIDGLDDIRLALGVND